MITLPQEIEILAKRLAEAKQLSIEDTIRIALEDKARADGYLHMPLLRDGSVEAVTARRARTDALVAALATLPLLDPRSPREIMDDLNAL